MAEIPRSSLVRWLLPTKKILALSLFLAWAALSFPLHAQNILQAPGLVVHYPENMEGTAEKVRDRYPRLRRDCEKKTGYRYQQELTVWVCRNHDDFNERIQKIGGQKKPNFVAAVAFPLLDLIVLKSGAWTRNTPGQFDVIFQHEISHCLFGQLVRKHPQMEIPLWFNEGVAQWVSEGLFRPANTQLQQALRKDAWIPFDSLDEEFPEQEGASSLAYAQSESMVRFIAEHDDEHGQKGNIHGILIRMTQGESFEEALIGVTKLDLRGMEKAWSEGRRSFFALPLSVFPDAIFALTIVILSLLGFATYRVRRNARMAELEAEDREQQQPIGLSPSDAQDPDNIDPPQNT